MYFIGQKSTKLFLRFCSAKEEKNCCCATRKEVSCYYLRRYFYSDISGLPGEVIHSSLGTLSAPFDTVKYSKFLCDRLPSSVPVEKIPHDLCPVPQPDTTGKAAWHQHILMLRMNCLLEGDSPTKGESMSCVWGDTDSSSGDV